MPDEVRTTDHAAPDAASAALRGLCPRCGARTLFAGWVRLADRCGACGLAFHRFDVGDGPAAFLTAIVGTLIVGLGVWLELAVAPPPWVHVLLWVPLTAAAVVGSLRIAKAVLLGAEYRHAAHEGLRQDEAA